MDTNENEKQLKTKCENEIAEVVNSFIDDIDKLNKKYGGISYTAIKPLATRSLSIMNDTILKKVLCNSLNERFGNDMLAVKTKILIQKIDKL